MLKLKKITSTSSSQLLHPFALLKFLQRALPDDLTLNVVLIFKVSGFQTILKLLPHAHFRFRMLIPLHCQVSSCSIFSCTEYVKTYISCLLSPYYNPTTYTSCESLRT